MNWETLKYVLVFIATSFCSVYAVTGPDEEGMARSLGRFETEWLAANLNGDGRWLERLVTGKHTLQLALPESAKQREVFVKELQNVDVPDDAMKVRITGTISFLTNDPTKNRSF